MPPSQRPGLWFRAVLLIAAVLATALAWSGLSLRDLFHGL